METLVQTPYKEVGSCLNPQQMLLFLAEKMEKDEQALVDKHLESCTLCVEALENLHHQGMNNPSKVLQFQDDFAQGLDQHSSQLPQGGSFNWLRIAAAILLLAIAGGAWFHFSPSKMERLFNESYQPYLAAQDLTWMGSENDTQLKTALAAYKAEDYESAIVLFEAVQNPEDPKRIYLYLGNCHLALGHGHDAIPYFTLATAKGEPNYAETAQWYRALALLETEDKARCKALLWQISEGGAYADDAKKLLNKLQ